VDRPPTSATAFVATFTKVTVVEKKYDSQGSYGGQAQSPNAQVLISSVYLSQLLNWQNSCLFAPYLTDKNGKYPSP
jgi:hypothetical protein